MISKSILIILIIIKDVEITFLQENVEIKISIKLFDYTSNNT
jgi:hypothetical protein